MKKYHKYIVFFNVLLVVGISFFISLKNVLADEFTDEFFKESKEMTNIVNPRNICMGKKTGDVNCDGKIDKQDSQLLSDYLAEKLDEVERNMVEITGDVNFDSRITVRDLTDLTSIIETGSSISGRLDATSCADFGNPDNCNSGISENGRFNCVWNEKYKFCSLTGLTYLSCGSDKSDAHDIPVFLPRITSYAIIILKTATPIILIIMSMIQIIKAIASQNEDEMKKAKSALVKKIIAAALIFFVTTIVQFVIKQVADSSEAGSANQCLSCFVNNDCNGSMYYTDGYGKCYNVKTKEEFECNTDIGDNYKNGFLNNNS